MSTENSTPPSQSMPSEEESLCVIEKTPPNQSQQPLQQRLQELPVVDKQKVEDIKNQLNNYDFNVDPQSIAQKIIALENALFNVNDTAVNSEPLKPSEKT